jgi:hypothetical protein
MLYLSKGIKIGRSGGKISIVLGGQTIGLNEAEASLWEKGEFNFAATDTHTDTLLSLEERGLVECEAENSPVSRYFILTRCIFCVSDAKVVKINLSKLEKEILVWLKNASIHLSVAELIYLIEHKVEPSDDLLYEENRQALVEKIYTTENIADNILENQMLEVQCRDEVVNTLISLLKKRYLDVL